MSADRCEISLKTCSAHVACEVRVTVREVPQVWRKACYRHSDALFAAIAEAERATGRLGLWSVECRPDPILRAAMAGAA